MFNVSTKLCVRGASLKQPTYLIHGPFSMARSAHSGSNRLRDFVIVAESKLSLLFEQRELCHIRAVFRTEGQLKLNNEQPFVCTFTAIRLQHVQRVVFAPAD